MSNAGRPRKTRKVISKIAGLLFAAMGLYFMVKSVGFFFQQLVQRDWVITTAAITEVAQRRETTGSIRHRRGSSSRTVYDIQYEYQVNGARFQGKSDGKVDYRAVGDAIQIKYNPDQPENNTDLLELSPLTLPVNLLTCGLFLVFSLAVSGILSDLRKKKLKRNSSQKSDVSQ